MIGWAAARGELGAEAWSLFAILFVWQIPHFFAIAWMYRDDYDRAGFRMLSSGDEWGAQCESKRPFLHAAFDRNRRAGLSWPNEFYLPSHFSCSRRMVYCCRHAFFIESERVAMRALYS